VRGAKLTKGYVKPHSTADCCCFWCCCHCYGGLPIRGIKFDPSLVLRG